MQFENHPYSELAVGQTAELTRQCTAEDLVVFANASGNHNPLHLRDIDGDGPAEQRAPSM
jgi:phosphate butyryltransferase